MLVKDLSNYVKFVFVLKSQAEDFVTSDVEKLKWFTKAPSFKIGDIIEAGGVNVKISDIELKQVDDTVRSNKYGFSATESSMQGELKDSVITVVITVEEQLD